MLPDIYNLLTNSTSILLSPSYQPGIWFYALIFLVILLGSVFIITPLPQNSLLFVAGVMAVNDVVSLEWVLISSIAGAYIGYDLNYWTGHFFNLTVCRNACPRIFGVKNMIRAEQLLTRFGPLSVIISRFIPVVNLPPFYAGLKSMNYIRYMIVNVTGAMMWCGITVVLGYYFGNFTVIQENLNILYLLIILVLIVTFLYAGFSLILGLKKGKNSPD